MLCFFRKKLQKETLCGISVFLFALIAIFSNLGSDGIYAAQEGRTALILRNMCRTGEWSEMRVDYGVPYEKPIGHYWLCLPSALAAGIGGDAMECAVEWGIRLPSALCALFSLLLTGLLARRLYGKETGYIAVIVLSTMSAFDKLGRLGHIDMPLAAAFTAAMYFLYTGYAEEWKSNRRIYLFYAALGWGVLLKGPLPVILAGIVVVSLMVMRKEKWYEVLRDMRLFRGAVIFLAVALPWYLYECYRTNGAFFEEFIVNQNFRRFTGVGSTYRDGEFMPVWYYFPKLFAGALPWSVLSVIGMAAGWKRLIRLRFSGGTWFLAVWLVTGFVFFSLSALKRGDYLLPLYPPLAILTAAAVAEGCRKLPPVPKWWLGVWGGLAGLLVLAFALNASGVFLKLGEMIVNDEVPFGAKRDGMSMIMISGFLQQRTFLLILAVIVLLGILFLCGKLLEKQKYFRVFGIISVIVLAAFLSYHLAIEPGTDCLKTVKSFAREARTLVAPEERVAYLQDFNTEMIFFMDRSYQVELTEDIRWVVAPPETAEELLREQPGIWREHLRTVPDHQYPAVLLERRKQ